MSRRVIISGLGPVSALGLGIEPTFRAAVEGRSAIGPITAFDPSQFQSRIGAEIRDFKVAQFVPKSYRKATKVMARDIELAVAAADLAARDAGLLTKGTINEQTEIAATAMSYPSSRISAHIGAGLIAAEINELTLALIESRDASTGAFDIHKWGKEGMNHLTPLWLLKYLPNMLACHVTIIHDAQGPSNTITCSEASSGLSVGEAFRVIQRGAADVSFCGGMESKLNPVVFLRQQLAGVLNTTDNDRPTESVRPFCRTAAGMVVGEGGAIVILEAWETWNNRRNKTSRAYAEVVGFGASQSVNPATRNVKPDAEGRAIASAIRTALREAGLTGENIDLIIPFGSALPDYDRAEAAALRAVFADKLPHIPIVSPKAMLGNCGAGAGGLDICLASKALAEQTVPATINCTQPLDNLLAQSAPSRKAALRYVLTFTSGMGGQNAALVLKAME